MLQKPLEFSVAYKAIAGARDYQEDCIKIWRPEGGEAANAERSSLLAALSDGMGGHVSGEVASNLVCSTVVDYFQSAPGEPATKLEGAVLASNASLEKAIRADPRLSGMGCTVVLAYLDGEGLRWASVGDSQLLIFRDNLLYRLNDDHSLGALLDKQAEARVITFEEAHNSPHRRSLRSAMTGGKIAIADIEREPLQLQPGDWVIVASDGLETLSGTEIASIIGLHGERQHPLDVAEKLLEAITLRNLPTQDNTSIIAIRVQEATDEKTQLIRASANRPGETTIRTASPVTETARLKRGHVIGRVEDVIPAAPGRQRKGSTAGLLLAVAMVLVAVAGFYYVYAGAPAGSLSKQPTPTRPSSAPANSDSQPQENRGVEGRAPATTGKGSNDGASRTGPAGRPNQ